MLTINTPVEAERFVRRQQRLGNDVRWDGWDLVFFREAPQGVYSKDGAFRNGAWGFENRSPVNAAGQWEVDYRNVRRAPKKHPRD